MGVEKDSLKKVQNFFFEAGALKRVSRSGWWLLGVKNPESVAEHGFRTALMAFILSELEGLSREDARRAVVMALFHDLPEARCNDLHKMGARYVKGFSQALENAAQGQSMLLPKETAKEFLQGFKELEARQSGIAVIVKDADVLELAFQAKEYADLGVKEALKWLKSAKANVKTKSAKKLLSGLQNKNSCAWLEELNKSLQD